ncbi:MAG: DUF3387 domain-containing protein [Magnetococcales bacterium]|nr:DUF3387 domain-containing protein [Magnetococcales bacterium]
MGGKFPFFICFFKDKQGGLVVDYIGIANELQSALKEYEYPPDQQDSAIDLVLQQAQAIGEEWS